MAQIKACQFITLHEHPIHIGHLAGVQVTHARDGFKFSHTIEPIAGGRRAGIGERGVKDHLGHIVFGAVGVPSGIVGARVQVVGRARAGSALVVVVERQRLVRRRVAGIGLSFSGEVTRVARAAVDVGVGLVNVAGIIGSAHAAHQARAVLEHI